MNSITTGFCLGIASVTWQAPAHAGLIDDVWTWPAERLEAAIPLHQGQFTADTAHAWAMSSTDEAPFASFPIEQRHEAQIVMARYIAEIEVWFTSVALRRTDLPVLPHNSLARSVCSDQNPLLSDLWPMLDKQLFDTADRLVLKVAFESQHGRLAHKVVDCEMFLGRRIGQWGDLKHIATDIAPWLKTNPAGAQMAAARPH